MDYTDKIVRKHVAIVNMELYAIISPGFVRKAVTDTGMDQIAKVFQYLKKRINELRHLGKYIGLKSNLLCIVFTSIAT